MAPRSLLRTVAITLLALLAGATGLVASAGAASAAPTPDAAAYEFLGLMNRARQSAGLPAMVADVPLAGTSVTWSNTMSSQNRLYHDPNLAAAASSVEPNWRRVGENVGVGWSVTSLHDAFMSSTGHRDNILSPGFNRVGIGVTYGGDGRMWVTVRFLEGPTISGANGLASCIGARSGSTVVVGADVNGDGRDDLLANTPSRDDQLLRGQSSRVFDPQAVAVGGSYIPITGDFTGRGRADVIWYAPGSSPDYLWRYDGASFTSTPLTIGGTYVPSVGDMDGDGRDDILWYAAGYAKDYVWYGTGTVGRFESRPITANGHYQVAIADLDGDNRSDVVWYAKGTAKDYINYGTGRGSFQSIPVTINGDYRPASGDFDGDRKDDILWHAPGSAKDFIWYGLGARGAYYSQPMLVGGSYAPVTGDYDGDCRSDIVWTTGYDVDGAPIWYGSGSRGGFGQDHVRTG